MLKCFHFIRDRYMIEAFWWNFSSKCQKILLLKAVESMKYEDIQERRQKIMRFVQRNQVVTITDVIEYMQISASTVRRDIDWLEANDKIGRHHGSIFIADGQYDVFDVRDSRFVEEKRRIGEYAASLVKSGDTIYVGAGTTMQQFAQCLVARPDIKDVFVVSSAINVATCLASDPRFTVFLLPGIMISMVENLKATGKTFSTLREFNFTKSITGTSAIIPDRGIMMPAYHFAETTRVAYEQASEVIVLTDHSKFSLISPYVVCRMDQVDRIVCDKHPDVEKALKHNKEYMKYMDLV